MTAGAAHGEGKMTAGGLSGGDSGSGGGDIKRGTYWRWGDCETGQVTVGLTAGEGPLEEGDGRCVNPPAVPIPPCPRPQPHGVPASGKSNIQCFCHPSEGLAEGSLFFDTYSCLKIIGW